MGVAKGRGLLIVVSKISLASRTTATPSPQACSNEMLVDELAQTMNWSDLSTHLWGRERERG